MVMVVVIVGHGHVYVYVYDHPSLAGWGSGFALGYPLPRCAPRLRFAWRGIWGVLRGMAILQDEMYGLYACSASGGAGACLHEYGATGRVEGCRLPVGASGYILKFKLRGADLETYSEIVGLGVGGGRNECRRGVGNTTLLRHRTVGLLVTDHA